MKLMKRIFSFIVAGAVAAVTFAVTPVTAQAANTGGYWKYTGTKIYCLQAPGKMETTKASFDKNGTKTAFKTTRTDSGYTFHVTQKSDESSGVHDLTFTSPAASYYSPGEKVSVGFTAKVQYTPGTASYHKPETKARAGFTEGKFSDDSLRQSYSISFKTGGGSKEIAAKADKTNRIGKASGTLSAKFPDPASLSGKSGIINIYISCKAGSIGLGAVYTYKWTKGTKPSDAEFAYIQITMEKGSSIRLDSILTDGTAAKAKYSSSKSSVASVSSSGKVTAKSKGTAVITITCDNITIKIHIKVT